MEFTAEIDEEEIFQITRSIQEEEDLHIRIFEDISLDKAIIVQGFPSTDFVGHLCCKYLMLNNKVRKIAGVYSKFFTPMLQMFDGEIIYPITLFKILNLKAEIDNETRTIYILVSDTPIPEILVFKLMSRLFNFYQKMKINHIITLDGLEGLKQPSNSIPRVYELTLPNDQSLFNLQGISNTFLTGPAAACLILSNSIYPTIANTVLLVESSSYTPNPEVILKVLKTLKKRIPALKILPKSILGLVERLIKNTGTPFIRLPPGIQQSEKSKEKMSDFQLYG
ncbi:MAG: PAC2 family protein [Promethearchaeota archaeon]